MQSDISQSQGEPDQRCSEAACGGGCPSDAAVAATPSAQAVADALVTSGVWRAEGEGAAHRLSAAPFVLSASETAFLKDLGCAVWAFYKALNHLWFRKGFAWVHAWLDAGKPAWLLDLARMNYSRQHLPRLLRPDLILCQDRMWVTELDSVPGGAGMTAAMAAEYARRDRDVIGGGTGIPESFARTIADLAGRDGWTLGVVVSDESEDYRAEMSFLARLLNQSGSRAVCLHPREVAFREDGLYANFNGQPCRLDVLWRFFELFDLRNIPKHELVMYAGKKRMVVVSPPYKPFLEEKLALALIHHPLLEDFFSTEMGRYFRLMRECVPKTWVMDPAPVPAHAEIGGLRFRGKPVRDFRELAVATQKERRLVVKPSGFSPLAWGARGVVVGHDVSQEKWAQALEQALDSFGECPYVLQEFHEGRRVEASFLDPATGKTGTMHGRVRLSPYYYVSGDEPELAGVLATICPDDKKLIHGMKDAVMTVCAEGVDTGV